MSAPIGCIGDTKSAVVNNSPTNIAVKVKANICADTPNENANWYFSLFMIKIKRLKNKG